jgi:Flp pilus assembly secretin CpaC
MLMIPATFAFKTLAITSPNILTSTDLARPAMLSSILMPNPYTEAALQTPVAMVKITLSNGVTRRLAEPTLNQITWMTAKPLELAFLTNATGTPKS